EADGDHMRRPDLLMTSGMYGPRPTFWCTARKYLEELRLGGDKGSYCMNRITKSALYWHCRQQLKQLLWKHGWDLRPLTPLNGIDVMLWKLLPELKVNCVIDVGAHTGEFALQIRSLGYTGRIASFEPTHEAFIDLHHRVQEDSDWHAYPVALGSSAGTADI